MQSGAQLPWWQQAYIVGPFFAAVGYLFGLFLDRFSDFRKAPDRLREDLKKGTLGSYGRKRLKPLAKTDLERFCAAFPEPPQVLQKALKPGPDKLLGLQPNFDSWESEPLPEKLPPFERPVLIYLSAEGAANLRIGNDLAGELKQLLEYKATLVGTFKEMLQLCQPPVHSPPRVLIAVPNLIVRGPEALSDILRQLAGVVRDYFVSATVGLIFFATADIRKTLAGMRESEVEERDPPERPVDSSAKPVSQAQEYNRFRDDFSSLLRRGWLGRRRSLPENGMSDLVAARLAAPAIETLDLIASQPGSFTTLGIWGPPGSGKTSLALFVSCRLVAKSDALVLDVSHEEIAARLSNSSSWSRDQAELILGKLAYDLMPNVIDDFGQRENAFQDAWRSVIHRRHPPVVLLVDDLYASGGTRDVCNALRPAAERLGIKLILVDRAQLRPVTADERMYGFPCELWTRAEAIRLLENWVPAESHPLLNSEVTRGWLADQRRFSSYLLEIVARNLGDLQAADSEKLLRETMRSQTERIGSSLAGTAPAPQELLNEITQLLTQNEPRESILRRLGSERQMDPVLLLGQISWFSQFTHEVPAFGVNEILGWSAGLLTMTESAAKGVLDAGLSAGIFGLDERGRFLKCVWSNPLVRDGCAALYLRHQFAHIEPSTTAEMVRRLYQAGSLEILTLALDVDMLLKIVEAIGATSEMGGDLVDRLVTGQLMSRLALDADQRNRLIQAFLTFAATARDEYSTAVSLCRALAQLLPLSPELAIFIDQFVQYEDPKGTLAIAVLCARLMNDPAFFERFRNVRTDAVPVEIAVRLWSLEGVRPLLDRLAAMHSQGEEEAVERLWGRFCERQQARSFDELLALFQEDKWFNSQCEEFSIIVSRIVFSALRNTQMRSPSSARLQMLQGLAGGAIQRAFKLLAAETAKWICLYLNSDLTSAASEWLCYPLADDAKRTVSDSEAVKVSWYAIPRHACEPATVPSIVQRTMQGGPVTLASVKDLKACGVRVAGRELTIDYLPEGFRASHKYNGSMLAAWDGSSAKPPSLDTTIFHLEQDKIHWRPRLSLSGDFR